MADPLGQLPRPGTAGVDTALLLLRIRAAVRCCRRIAADGRFEPRCRRERRHAATQLKRQAVDRPEEESGFGPQLLHVTRRAAVQGAGRFEQRGIAPVREVPTLQSLIAIEISLVDFPSLLNAQQKGSVIGSERMCPDETRNDLQEIAIMQILEDVPDSIGHFPQVLVHAGIGMDARVDAIGTIDPGCVAEIRDDITAKEAIPPEWANANPTPAESGLQRLDRPVPIAQVADCIIQIIGKAIKYLQSPLVPS